MSLGTILVIILIIFLLGGFSGRFGGNLAYVKMGSGTQILCGPNFHTGGTTVSVAGS